MTGFVIEIVDSKTGHISEYPLGSLDERAMTDQIDWQRRFNPNYRWFYRIRYHVDACDPNADGTPIAICPLVTTATPRLCLQTDVIRLDTPSDTL